MLQSRKKVTTSGSERVVCDLMAEAGIQIGGGGTADPEVLHPRFYQRVLSQGSLGMGESYMDGDWECEALDQFFAKVLRVGLNRKVISSPGIMARMLAHFLNPQSLRRSRRVAEVHYDLGNDFYQEMLDPRMQYTCAYWKASDTLADAQEAKLDLICRKLQLRESEHVLELGGGWGGFARFAAERYGCRVTSYNISTAQVNFAREYCRGLPVEIRHEDYRNARGSYDKVVSIGICEHVGDRNYPGFLALKERCLKDDGLMLLHTIGCPRTKHTSDPWIAKYIFPGGQLPSLRQLTQAAEPYFTVEDLHNLGADYDPTLMAWFHNFDHAWHRYREPYGERFYRMWKYYLLSCAGAFRARSVHLWQIVFSKRGVPGGYLPVR